MLKTKAPARIVTDLAPFGVYVHWPFCAAKCPYCDFNSHVRHGEIDHGRFLAAYLKELDHFASLAPNRTVTSIFFGGGTPSLMPPAVTEAILNAIAGHWPIHADVEITLEANPNSVEAEKFKAYRSAGVNRLSLGVQALDDESLKSLGRLHSADEALKALGLARETFPRISFDLIYAREGQSPSAWERELERALTFAADHLSLYQLTIEEGTPFAALYDKGRLTIPPSDEAREMYLLTQALCEQAGLPAYEVSNHAGQDGQSRHNLIYWRGHDYAGVGAGAHARIAQASRKWALSTLRLPEAWLAQVEEKGHGFQSEEALSPDETAEEYLLMSLRLSEGMNLSRYADLGGAPLDEDRVGTLEAEGLLKQEHRHLIATPAGRLVLERIILELAA